MSRSIKPPLSSSVTFEFAASNLTSYSKRDLVLRKHSLRLQETFEPPLTTPHFCPAVGGLCAANHPLPLNYQYPLSPILAAKLSPSDLRPRVSSSNPREGAAALAIVQN